MSAKEWILFALAALGLLPREERPGFARTPSDTEMITVLASVPVRDRAAAALLRKESVPVLSPRRLTHLVRPTQSAVAAGIHAGLRRYPAAGDPPPDKVRRGRD